jgi:hypothetical protein
MENQIENKNNNLKKEGIFKGYIFVELILFIILALFIRLHELKLINQQTLLFISLFVVGSIVLIFLAFTYLKFVITVRDTKFFPDNRTANFLTFDLLKFILILTALISIVIMGLNKVLNNETIATLLGGLVGSLLSLKGSYHDLPSPNEKDKKNNEKTPTK